MARNGKIARLPIEIRGELNRRLRSGEKARRLVPWLNSMPEVAEGKDPANSEQIRVNPTESDETNIN
jgi:hypothetical protein